MAATTDVLIIGGGVIGLTTAVFLRKAGLSVTVLDGGDLGQESSWAGAGIISAAASRPRTPLERLATCSDALLETLHEELRREVRVDNGYFRCGGCLLLPPDEADAAAKDWREAGVEYEELSPSRLATLEPLLRPGDARVFLHPSAAQLRNPRHVKALLAWLKRHEARLEPHCPALGLQIERLRVVGIQTPAGVLRADRYLIASGAWSDQLLAPLGWQPGIHPVRGQIALLQQCPPALTRVIEVGKRYLVPRPDGRILVGATEEWVGFVKKNTAGAVAGLLAFAQTLVPELASVTLERCWSGLRPGTPDGLPILGPVPGIEDLFVAAGHFRSGIMLSAGTAEVMTQLLTGQTPTLDLDAFRLDRPSLLPRQS